MEELEFLFLERVERVGSLENFCGIFFSNAREGV